MTDASIRDAASTERAGASESTSPTPAAGSAQIVPVVGAVVSSVGVLGFVIFAAGAVMWQRFARMGLPADEAVARVPRQVLIATGADFLVPAVLVTAATVLLTLLTPIAWNLLPPKRRPSSEARRWRTLIAIGLIIFGIDLASALYAAVYSHIAVGPFFLLVGIGAIGSAGIAYAQWTPRLGIPAVGLVTFLAVGSFWIARGYEQNFFQPAVIPMAFAVTPPGAITEVDVGYFVAETGDRLVFASQPAPPANGLREVPRDEIGDLELGAVTPTAQASREAAHFAYELCSRMNARVPAPSSGAARITPCSAAYVTELARQSGGAP